MEEVYFVDFENLCNLVGFGPVEGNKSKTPMFAIFEEWVITCEFYTGHRIGEKADIYFPDRNYILPKEFNSVDLCRRVENLVTNGTEFVVDLGESWDEERAFIWKRTSEKFSKNFRVTKGIRVRRLNDIARAVQINDVLLSILGVHSPAKVPRVKKRVTDVSGAIQELFSESQCVESCCQNRPNLDQLDGTYIG